MWVLELLKRPEVLGAITAFFTAVVALLNVISKFVLFPDLRKRAKTDKAAQMEINEKRSKITAPSTILAGVAGFTLLLFVLSLVFGASRFTKEIRFGVDRIVDVTVRPAKGEEPDGGYPIVLALPLANGSKAWVDVTLDMYWSGKGSAEGMIVIVPHVFGPKVDGEMLDGILDWVMKQDQAYDFDHVILAGVLDGGRAALALATLHPDKFAGVITMGGEYDGNVDKLAELRDKKVWLIVGEESSRLASVEKTEQDLHDAGAEVELTRKKGQGDLLNIEPAVLAGWIAKTSPDRP